MVAAGAGHDDGVATLPEQWLGDVDAGAPFSPGGGAVMFRRAAGGGLDAEVTSEAAAPGGFAVVFVEPCGGLFDPAGDGGICGRSRGFFGAKVGQGGGVDLGRGGHVLRRLSKKRPLPGVQVAAGSGSG